MEFLGLIVSSIVVEGIVSYAKLFMAEGKLKWQNVLAILLGVIVSVTYQIDIFAIVGLPSVIPYVGIILTGILISRGSNYAYEVIKMIMNFTAKAQLSNETINM